MPSLIILGPDDQPAPPVASQHSNQQQQDSQHSSVSVEAPKAVAPSVSSAIPSDQSSKDLQKELNLARGFLFQMQKNFADKVRVKASKQTNENNNQPQTNLRY